MEEVSGDVDLEGPWNTYEEFVAAERLRDERRTQRPAARDARRAALAGLEGTKGVPRNGGCE